MRAAKRSAVAGRFGGECRFSKVIRDGVLPPEKTAPSIFWSAREDWGSGGKKTSANLTAICHYVSDH